ncbi:hypothetical protein AJ78_08713 [Emergomyces pasteurianus Ep9510]|uniref:Uncharacterized protein n=1 Tax=Emergomyces pasteurianus Ep9510 TaxID=1447872 RepID=A0A1J9P1E5_9EURO|nr:hypothetical protein AJ78_08713 [Emergomyces pasteurianus Ep9510]
MSVEKLKVLKAGRSRTPGRLALSRKLNYKVILKQHEVADCTSRIYSANAERSRRTVQQKLQR